MSEPAIRGGNIAGFKKGGNKHRNWGGESHQIKKHSFPQKKEKSQTVIPQIVKITTVPQGKGETLTPRLGRNPQPGGGGTTSSLTRKRKEKGVRHRKEREEQRRRGERLHQA